MYNLRINGILAAIAFILSLLIGLFSRATMPMLIIRPLIFAALFFALSTLAKILVSRFLPELLEEDVDDFSLQQPGSRVDITEEDSQIDGLYGGLRSAVVGQDVVAAKPDDSEENLGNISDLASKNYFSKNSGEEISSGMDHNTKEGYNVAEDFGNFTESSMSNMGGSGGVDFFGSDEVLPDLDSMAGAFMQTSTNVEPEVNDYQPSGPLKKPSSDKAPAWTEDFNAKEIAQGLRTVLNKDKEG